MQQNYVRTLVPLLIAVCGSPLAAQQVANRIIVLEGEGVVVREGDFSDTRFRDTPPHHGRTRIRVVNANSAPVPGAAVTWTVLNEPISGARWTEGSLGLGGGVTTVTDGAGETSNIFVAPGTGTVGTNPFRQVLARLTVGAVTADLHFVAIPIISDNTLTPYPLNTFLAPGNDPLSISGTIGSILPGAIQVRFSSAGSGFGAAIPNVGLHIDARDANPSTGPSAACDPAPVVLSDSGGIATCNLRLTGTAGSSSVRVRLGGYAERILNLTASPGTPNTLRIVSGNNQSGQPGTRAAARLVVETVNGSGTPVPAQTVSWEVIQGSATFDFPMTVSDGQGRTSNGLTFGQSAGIVRARATLNGTASSVTFDLSTAAAPRVLSLSPASGSGVTGTFVFDFEDPDGAGDLSVLNVLVNSSLDGRQSCYLAYVPSSASAGTVLLVNDNGDAGGPFAGSLALPGSGMIQNSRCQISAAGSSVSTVGNRLTLILNMTFTGSHAGRRILYLAARDRAGNNSGWRARSVWAVPGAPATSPRVDSLAPARSAASTVTVSASFTDNDGAADLNILNLLVASAVDGRNACYIAVIRPTGTAVLVNDAGAAGGPFAGTIAIPGTGTASNSQCQIEASG